VQQLGALFCFVLVAIFEKISKEIMSFGNAKVTKTEPLAASEAKWTRFLKATYIDPKGTERTWEYGERPTRPKNSDIDAVAIVAILEKSTGPEIILQKQFRPPLDKIVIEIPAGLVDEGETPEQAAVREMKEETGYVGKVISEETSMIMYNGKERASSFCLCLSTMFLSMLAF
ncbi:hypothetical protein DH86_00003460, partial [Scytalidium sp. 3C]